jgi:hypothetical protein
MGLSSTLTYSGKIGGMTSLPNLDQLNPEQLRASAAQLMQRVESLDQTVETMGKRFTVTKRLSRS